jgi:zinc protease
LSLCLLLVLLTPVQRFGQQLESRPENPTVLRIQKYDLLNGLKTFVVQQKGAPGVAVSLLVRAGPAADPPVKNGMADLMGRMLFAINPRKSNEQWKDELQALGVEFKIRLDPEATVFEALVPGKYVEPYLALLNTMVLYPHFQPERVDAAKQLLITNLLGGPQTMELAEEHFHELIFGRHPYARAFRGSPESLKGIQAVDLENFYHSFYIPNNSALVVVGDVVPSEIMSVIREKWGGWTKGTRSEVYFTKLGIRDNYTLLVIPRRGSASAALIYGQVGPPRVTSDYFSLRVLNAVLGGQGPSSHLAEEFNRRHLNFQELQSLFKFYEAGGEFQVRALVPNESVSQSLQAIADAIEDLKQNRVTEAELKTAQATLIKTFTEGLKSPVEVANHVVTMELYDLASDFLVAFPQRVEQVSVERLQETAKTYLEPSRAAAVIVGDPEKLPPDLNKLGNVRILGDSGSATAKSALD